ncbi:MAG: hypothetical protein II685_06825 [Clostridia bacterium]|nr:hypothetical protein [Clostridia bacterium]
MLEYEEKLQELKEKVIRLEYEIEEKNSEILTLKRDNSRLYESVKQNVDHAGMYKTELENDKKFYTEKVAALAKEKAELSEKLDVLTVDFDKYKTIYDTVTQAKAEMKKESLKLMDEVRETSMDAVTVIDYVLHDIAKMKLDLDNMSKAESKSQGDLDEEIQLMIDLLNKHINYLGTIKKGFYKINNINEYSSSFDDLSLNRTETKIVDGNYVD